MYTILCVLQTIKVGKVRVQDLTTFFFNLYKNKDTVKAG
jgi:hypothetical protein